MHSLKLLLWLSGDVEVNPGFDDATKAERMLEELLSGQARISQEINALTQNVASFDERLNKVETWAAESSDVAAKVHKLEFTVTKLYSVINELDRKNNDLENRSRRNSLLIHGLPEPRDENPDELIDSVTKMIKDKLEVQGDNIERCYRVGAHGEGKIRTIILKLLDFRTKANIVKNAHKLRGSETYINENFLVKVRKLRKLLWQHFADIRKNGRKIRLHRDCPVVDSVRYTWDETKSAIVRSSGNGLARNSPAFPRRGAWGSANARVML